MVVLMGCVNFEEGHCTRVTPFIRIDLVFYCSGTGKPFTLCTGEINRHVHWFIIFIPRIG